MKILLCNRAQFDNKKLVGGGVSVYLSNIIRGLVLKEKLKDDFDSILGEQSEFELH